MLKLLWESATAVQQLQAKENSLKWHVEKNPRIKLA